MLVSRQHGCCNATTRLVVRLRATVGNEIQGLNGKGVDMSVIERAVLVSPQSGIFGSTCEVIDTQEPETKILRFKEWSDTRAGAWDSVFYGPLGVLRFVHVYDSPDWNTNTELCRYRITAKLETPDGYVGAYLGTTKPESQKEDAPRASESSRSSDVEDMILSALTTGRMTLRDLKRKVSAHRIPDFDDCLKTLVDEGELTLEPDAEYPKRLWVVSKK